MTFKKGQSGNPNGRPRRDKTLTDAIKKILSEKRADGKTKAKQLAEVLVALALEEKSLPAIREIIDRIEGRPMQPLAHTDAEGGPLALSHLVKIIHDNSDQS